MNAGWIACPRTGAFRRTSPPRPPSLRAAVCGGRSRLQRTSPLSEPRDGRRRKGQAQGVYIASIRSYGFELWDAPADWQHTLSPVTGTAHFDWPRRARFRLDVARRRRRGPESRATTSCRRGRCRNGCIAPRRRRPRYEAGGAQHRRRQPDRCRRLLRSQRTGYRRCGGSKKRLESAVRQAKSALTPSVKLTWR